MIAYLVLAHRNTEQLRLLIATLAGDPRSQIYLHMDCRKTPSPDLPEFAGRLRIVPRMRVNWAGYTMIEATLRLLRTALADHENERFVLLSGSCFPLWPITRINDLIQSGGNRMALWRRVTDATAGRREINAFGKFHFPDIRLLNPSRNRLMSQIWKLGRAINARLPYRRRVAGPIVKGSQWFCVDRAMAEIFAAPHPRLAQLFRFAFAPDEMMFQTLYYRHADPAERDAAFVQQMATRQALHHIVFRPVPMGSTFSRLTKPAIDRRLLDETDLEDVLRSDALFVRKCTPGLARAIHAARHGGSL